MQTSFCGLELSDAGKIARPPAAVGAIPTVAGGLFAFSPFCPGFAKYQSIETLTREILTDLVDHIKVYENGNISVWIYPKKVDKQSKIVDNQEKENGANS